VLAARSGHIGEEHRDLRHDCNCHSGQKMDSTSAAS
jgi:hypothetical protein